MTFQKRIMHSPHLGMLVQKLSYAQSVLVLPLYPDGERLHTAQEEPGSVRIHGSAQRSAGFMNLLDQIPPSGDYAADQIGMPAKILGAGVHHQINAKLQRTLINRSGKCAVNQGDEIASLRQCRRLPQVN